jgi:hypothetical protein
MVESVTFKDNRTYSCVLLVLFCEQSLHTNYPGKLGNGVRLRLLNHYFTPASAETMVLL